MLEIVREVRAAVGPSYPISVKLNSADFQEGGFSSAEAVQVSQYLESEGVDLLEISGGNYEAGIYEETVTNFTSSASQSTINREAYFLSYAIKIKESIKSMPVMVTGGWRTKSHMENAIADGDCSLIGLGRPLCGDPDCAKKLLDGSIDTLPRYEQQLQTFHWTLQWIYYIPIRLLSVVNMLGKQAWYYRNIVSIAETGQADLTRGCFYSFLENNSHEQLLATNLKGGVQCRGSVYKGPV